MEKARQHSTLTFAGSRQGRAERQQGDVSRGLALRGFGVMAIVVTAIWLIGGWSFGQAVAAFMCAALVGVIALHIADHVAEFLQ